MYTGRGGRLRHPNFRRTHESHGTLETWFQFRLRFRFVISTITYFAIAQQSLKALSNHIFWFNLRHVRLFLYMVVLS